MSNSDDREVDFRFTLPIEGTQKTLEVSLINVEYDREQAPPKRKYTFSVAPDEDANLVPAEHLIAASAGQFAYECWLAKTYSSLRGCVESYLRRVQTQVNGNTIVLIGPDDMELDVMSYVLHAGKEIPEAFEGRDNISDERLKRALKRLLDN